MITNIGLDILDKYGNIGNNDEELLKYSGFSYKNNKKKLKTYYIDPKNVSNFWLEYCNMVFEINTEDNLESEENVDEEKTYNFNPFANIHVAEVIGDFCPIILEFVLRFEQTNVEKSYYDENFLRYIAREMQKVINTICLIDENKFENYCFVLVSEPWNDNINMSKNIKFRFQFPFCRIESKIIQRKIRPLIISSLEDSECFSLLYESPIEKSWEKLTKGMGKTEISLYGSSSDESSSKIKLEHIWTDDNLKYMDRIIDDDELMVEIEEETIYSTFNPKIHIHVKEKYVDESIFYSDDSVNNIIDSDTDRETQINKEFWLPMLFSIHYYNKIASLRPISSSDFKKPIVTNQKIFGIKPDKIDTDNKLEMCKDFLNMIDPNKFVIKILWLDIVKALNNASNNTDAGLEILIEYTKNAFRKSKELPDFYYEFGNIEETCRVHYYQNNNTPITVKTLAWYATEDNPNAYKEWHKNWCLPAMEAALSLLPYDISLAFRRCYWLDFVCSNFVDQTFYVFNGNRWDGKSGIQGIFHRMTNDFMKKFEREELILGKISYKSSGDEKIAIDSVREVIKKLIKVIKTNIKPCYQYISNEFYDCDFVNYINRNPYLTCTLNGTIEVYEKKIIYRSSKPEDYITMNLPIRYEYNFSYKHPLVIETMEWLHKVFPYNELLDDFLRFSSSGLIALNLDKIFAAWIGEKGNNSKSMLTKLFEATFGEMCIDFPVEMLCINSSRNAGNANPQLARAKFARFAFVSEPDDDKVINKGPVKKLTGGDRFYARMLHDNGGDIIATFKMIIVANNAPRFFNVDSALENRMRIYPFLAEWVKNAPESIHEQFKFLKFPMNTSFEKRIPYLAPAFFWIICDYFQWYAQDGMAKIPEIVRKTNRDYWSETDYYCHFIRDCITEVYISEESDVLDKNAKESVNDLYKAFKTWYYRSFPKSNNVPDLMVFKREMKKKWGSTSKNHWKGIRIIRDEERDNLEEDEENVDDEEIVNAEIPNLSYMGDKLIENLSETTRAVLNYKIDGINTLMKY